MSEQVTDIFSLDSECSICLENIVGVSNKVVTDCGHTFHCKCLMKNITFNGFGCPYCRNAMAEYDGNYSDSDDEDVEDEDDEEEEDEEDIEDEEDEEDEEDIEEDIEDEEEENIKMPDATYVTYKLKEQGFTMEDLVKIHLFLEHGNWGRFYREYEENSGMLFREMADIIEQYNKPPATADVEISMPDDPNANQLIVLENNNLENNNLE
jgi:hypothetical protein